MIDSRRLRLLNQPKAAEGRGPVVYWMSRDQRVNDNWALIFAQELARKTRRKLIVLFCLVPEFLGATIRQYAFMLKGLAEVEADLGRLNISFELALGEPAKEIPRFLKAQKASVLVSDFSPLKISRGWKKKIVACLEIPFYEVDAHNIVPCFEASVKLEYGAYTIRPKIKKLLGEFLTDFPKVRREVRRLPAGKAQIVLSQLIRKLKIDFSVSEVLWIKPGEREAQKTLDTFVRIGLSRYDTARNDPTLEGQSNLSPYLHFGQISAQRIALEVSRAKASGKSKAAFLEELITRRELSDNFCLHNPHYDSIAGCVAWARQTLARHAADRRQYVYYLNEYETGQTHDALWNAAQCEMVKRGKMHGFLRMYWAKKILEWSPSPEEAIKTAIYLNDKYSLDGRDPNGYAGIAWSIGGTHDRAWGERPIFGKIRYMSRKGCESKFDAQGYIEKIERL